MHVSRDRSRKPFARPSRGWPAGRVTLPRLALALLAGLMATDERPAAIAWGEDAVAVAETRRFDFAEAGVQFDADFAGARLSACRQTGPAEFVATIRPENLPINNSAWYAFRVRADQPGQIRVRLEYPYGKHRYQPRSSRDGRRFLPLASNAWQVDARTRSATLTLDVGPQPVWIAGQELIDGERLAEWGDKLAEREFVTRSVLGLSREKRPLVRLEIADPAAPARYVYLIGRQHPPEVTGSLAMLQFVETIAGESDLAIRFRRAFRTVALPLVNPDGVAHGHWRHSMAGVDLNRDWEDFRQPETQAIRDDLHRLTAGRRGPLWLFLDFHATHRDLFYTESDDEPTLPVGFTRRWLDRLGAALPEYEVRRDWQTGRGNATSRRWVSATFGAPAITYELGDHTDRHFIHRQATAAARTMMTTLLEAADATQP